MTSLEATTVFLWCSMTAAGAMAELFVGHNFALTVLGWLRWFKASFVCALALFFVLPTTTQMPLFDDAVEKPNKLVELWLFACSVSWALLERVVHECETVQDRFDQDFGFGTMCVMSWYSAMLVISSLTVCLCCGGSLWYTGNLPTQTRMIWPWPGISIIPCAVCGTNVCLAALTLSASATVMTHQWQAWQTITLFASIVYSATVSCLRWFGCRTRDVSWSKLEFVSWAWVLLSAVGLALITDFREFWTARDVAEFDDRPHTTWMIDYQPETTWLLVWDFRAISMSVRWLVSIGVIFVGNLSICVKVNEWREQLPPTPERATI